MQYSTSSENYSTTFKDTPSKWSGKDGKGGYAYKKSAYQYSTTGNNSYSYNDKSIDQNIDQLDALLEDLKNERQVTQSKELISTPTHYRTIERENVQPGGGTITKTTRVIKSSKQLGGSQYLDDTEKYATSDYSTLRSNGGFSTLRDYPKPDEYRTRELTYEANKSLPSNSYETKSEIYKSNRILDNTELVVPNTTTSTTTTKHLERDLQDIALSDNILPAPGTKVTTTVRTYTYEIPANASTTHHTSSHNLNYSTLQRNETNLSGGLPPAAPPAAQRSPNVPQTVVYNTESYSTYNRNNERPVVSNRTYEVREHHESNTMHRNLTPQAPRQQPPIAGPPHQQPYTHSPSHSPQIPSGSSPQHGSYPPHTGPTTSRYFYKESSNTVNTIHGSPGGPPFNDMPPTVPYKQAPSADYPPRPDDAYPPQHGQPPQTTTYYKYTSSSSANTQRGPNYAGPTVPAPFPVDGVDFQVANGNPPQRVDDLMQSFGNADTVDRTDIEAPVRKREIETAVATPNQPHIPTVNKAGREVYYPPGHETTMMKREEMAAGSAAGGRWAKGSGMYEYESGYKSKSKTKSGGAMVPVCLPLCCAMPCTIM